MYKENPNTRGAERNAAPYQRMLLHPESFDPDKLTVSEIEQPDGTIIAKIPQIPNRITRRKKANSDGYYIELILSSHYDAETRQNRNKKVIIGEDVSTFLRGMMFANDNYHEYFNKNGDLLPHIKAMILEEERQKRQAKAAENTQPAQSAIGQPENSKQTEPRLTKQKQEQIPSEPAQKQAPSTHEQQQDPQELLEEEGEASEVQIRELKERQQELDRKEQELIKAAKALDVLRKELESQEMVLQIKKEQAIKDHIDLLNNILISHEETIEAQAKRKPDAPMRPQQIRTINELLQEIRTLFAGNEVEDFLHLAEEPNEESNTPGTTYGEMALLLNTYRSMLHHFAIGKLRAK